MHWVSASFDPLLLFIVVLNLFNHNGHEHFHLRKAFDTGDVSNIIINNICNISGKICAL